MTVHVYTWAILFSKCTVQNRCQCIYYNFGLKPILLPNILNRRIPRSSRSVAPTTFYQKTDPTWNAILIRVCFLLKFHRSNIKRATANPSEGGGTQGSDLWLKFFQSCGNMLVILMPFKVKMVNLRQWPELIAHLRSLIMALTHRPFGIFPQFVIFFCFWELP